MKLWAWLKCSRSTAWRAGLGAHAAPHAPITAHPRCSALASKSFKNQPEAQGGAADCESNLRPSEGGHSQSDGRLHHDSSIHLCIHISELSSELVGCVCVCQPHRRRCWRLLGVDGGRPGAALRPPELPLQGGDGRRGLPADLRRHNQLVEKTSPRQSQTQHNLGAPQKTCGSEA